MSNWWDSVPWLDVDMEKDKVISVTLGLGGTVKKIGADTPPKREMQASAFAAASDFFFFERYIAVPGLHLFTELKESDDLQPMIGYVAQWCKEEGVPTPKAGWKPLCQRVNNQVVGDFKNSKHANCVPPKHDCIDWFVAGNSLELRVFARQGLATFYLNMWQKDLEDAQKISEDAINNVAGFEQESGQAYDSKRSYYKMPSIKKDPVPADFKMRARSGVPVDIRALPIGWYKCYTRKGKYVKQLYWKGTEQSLQIFYDASKRGIEIEQTTISVPT